MVYPSVMLDLMLVSILFISSVMLCNANSLEQHVMDNEQVSEFHDIVQDKEHIKEEWEGLFSDRDIEQMTPEEKAFTWFQAHDGDANGFLDGLELYKSIHHAIQHNAEMPSDNIEDVFKLGQEDQAAIDLVDELIEHYDKDNDGLLDLMEFIDSYRDSRDKLNM